MRSSARAAVGVVAELVDVHAALGVGVVAGDVPADGCVGGFGRLLEGDGALDDGVTPENGNCGVGWSLALRWVAMSILLLQKKLPGRRLREEWLLEEGFSGRWTVLSRAAECGELAMRSAPDWPCVENLGGASM